jgi:hypothetical protein
MLKHAGAAPMRAVVAICEQATMPAGHAQLVDLNRGLSALSAFWSERRR